MQKGKFLIKLDNTDRRINFDKFLKKSDNFNKDFINFKVYFEKIEFHKTVNFESKKCG